MRSTRFIIRFLTAFIFRFKWIIILSLIIGISLFFVIRFLLPSIEGSRTEKIGVVGRYPNTESLPKNILEMVSTGLTRVNDKGEVEPAVAESWTTTDSGKTWIFKLKNNIYWQDGKLLTSDSLIYDFSDAKFKVIDKNTVSFTLQSPFSPFPVIVSKPIFKKGLLGVGNWKVSKATLAGGYIQQLVLISKNNEKKIYKFYPTEERAKLAYKLGQIDNIQNIYDPNPLQNWESIKIITEVNQNNFVAIFFNTSDPLLSNKTVRQALAYAIDKSSFDGPRAVSPISPTSWAFNPQVKQYSFDTERAKELLKDIPQNSISLKISTIPMLLPVAEKIVTNWKAVGINASVQVYTTIPQETQVLLAIFQIPQDPDQYALWHSTQENTNISHYKSPRIDKLLEDGRVELNLEARKKIYLDFQRFLIEDSPAIFLYHPITYTISRK